MIRDDIEKNLITLLPKILCLVFTETSIRLMVNILGNHSSKYDFIELFLNIDKN